MPKRWNCYRFSRVSWALAQTSRKLLGDFNLSNSATVHSKSASVLVQVCFDGPEKQVTAWFVQQFNTIDSLLSLFSAQRMTSLLSCQQVDREGAVWGVSYPGLCATFGGPLQNASLKKFRNFLHRGALWQCFPGSRCGSRRFEQFQILRSLCLLECILAFTSRTFVFTRAVKALIFLTH